MTLHRRCLPQGKGSGPDGQPGHYHTVMGISISAQQLNRRGFGAFLLLAATAACGAPTTAVRGDPATTTILVVGDSLSAEYGLRRGTGWVALLEKKLKLEQFKATVVNASISGDTTAGARARFSTLLNKHRPTLVVLELGGNDALRGLPLQLTKDNLDVMARAAQANGARVLLIGMQVPPNYGRDYASRFAKLFTEVAQDNQAGLVPFLLKGIADLPDSTSLFQADRIHPKEEAHPVMLTNIWPELKKLLK